MIWINTFQSKDCNKKLLLIKTAHYTVFPHFPFFSSKSLIGLLNHSVNVITFEYAQSDPIVRRALLILVQKFQLRAFYDCNLFIFESFKTKQKL